MKQAQYVFELFIALLAFIALVLMVITYAKEAHSISIEEARQLVIRSKSKELAVRIEGAHLAIEEAASKGFRSVALLVEDKYLNDLERSLKSSGFSVIRNRSTGEWVLYQLVVYW